MDNAGYHYTYPEDVPVGGKKKKTDWVTYLQSRNQPCDPKETVAILKARSREYIKNNERMICEVLANAGGHQVLFTPPCHSDLQPIELLWAKLKGNLGRQYYSGITMTVLKKHLKDKFELAMDWNESIEGFIRKTSNIATMFYNDSIKDKENYNDLDSTNTSDGSKSESASNSKLD
jgi:transposase